MMTTVRIEWQNGAMMEYDFNKTTAYIWVTTSEWKTVRGAPARTQDQVQFPRAFAVRVIRKIADKGQARITVYRNGKRRVVVDN